MYKKSTFIFAIFFLALGQFSYIPDGYAMFGTVAKVRKKPISVSKTRKIPLRAKYNIQRPSNTHIHRYSTKRFSSQEITEAFRYASEEKIASILSTQLLEDDIERIKKKTENYQNKILELKNDKEQFDLNNISKLSLAPGLPPLLDEKDNTHESEIAEKLVVEDLNALDETYKKIFRNINTFVSKTNTFILAPALGKALESNREDALELIRNQAEIIKKEISKADPFLPEIQKRLSELYTQKNSSPSSCYSEELKKLAKEITDWREICNEKKSTLKRMSEAGELDKSTYNNFNNIKNTIDKLQFNGELLRELERRTIRNGLEALELERWIESCILDINALKKSVDTISLNNSEYNNHQTIENGLSIIRTELANWEEKTNELNLSTVSTARKIKEFLDQNNPINNLFHDTIEIKSIQNRLQLLETSTELIEIEQNLKKIKIDAMKILNKQTESLNTQEELKEKIKYIKDISSKASMFIVSHKNAIKDNIRTTIKEEINQLNITLKNKNGTIKLLESSLDTLQKKWGEILADSSTIFDEDYFYSIAGIKTIRILSIDGGGVRGVIPTLILKKIEEETGKPIANQFDVMAGTSIGGLLTLALNVPSNQQNDNEGLKNKASNIAKMTKDDAQKIFPKKYFSFRNRFLMKYFSSKLWTYFKFPSQYLEGKKGLYSTTGLETVCNKYLGDELFKNAFSTVLIPTTRETNKDEKNDYLYVFNSREQIRPHSMKDVALATSAAPFFFAKKKMKDFVSHPEDSEEHFWDGGVVLNNPAREAYKKACNELFLKDRKKIRFLIVSIGTGKSAQSNLDVLGKTLSNIMDSAATAVDRDLKEEFEHNKNLGLYKRINVPLDKSIELNDASIEALNTLEVATENYLGGSEGKKDIKEIVSWLKQKRPYTTKGDIIEPDTFQAQRSVNGNSSQKEDL